MAWLIVTILLLLGYAGLILFYDGHFKKLTPFTAVETDSSLFVSVIIAARNEEKKLPHLLTALAAQSYPHHLFEVILVDDFSTDATAAVAQTFSKAHITVIQPAVAANQSSKKKAIDAGVQHAKGPLLLITDADCIPTKNWIETIASFHQKTGAVFIAAPVCFTHDRSILQLFQALDFLTLQGITAASVAAQFHTMCNGANLAYTKAAFSHVKGFAGIDHIASGDDMLLMHKIWQRYKSGVQYLKSRDAIVTTEPALTWKAFIAQRRRWASKTIHYKDKRVFFVLLFIYFFNVWFFVLLAACFWNGHIVLLAPCFLFFKTAIEWPFVARVAAFYNDKKLMRHFFFLQPLHLFYTVSIGFLSQLGSYEWKGRKTK
ncbi:MAG TPA: glycosyltransferase [Chitinophagaceae bacterium]|nr:glycosyltransferase [Chitinophagaceae bacterium]